MNYKLNNLTFVFENNDTITIDGKHINHLSLEDITENFSSFGELMKFSKTANYFSTMIHKEANVERYQFGIEDEELKQKTFERFLRDDIVQILLNLTNLDTNLSERRVYDVCWDISDTLTNSYQTGYINDNLYICVSKDYTVDQIYPYS